MPTISAGQSAVVTIPAGQAATFPAGPRGRASYLGAWIASIGPGVATIGPYQADRNVDVYANEDVNYTLAVPGAFTGGGGSSGSLASALVAYATTIPMDGRKYMPDTALVGTPAFVPALGAVSGAECSIGLIANGTTAPTFPGFIPDLNNDAWNNVAGRLHSVLFYNDRGRNFYLLRDTGLSVGSTVAANVRMTLLAKVTESGDATAGYSYTTTNVSGNGSLGTADSAVSTQRIPAGSDGYFECTFLQSDLTRYSPILTLRPNSVAPAFNTGLFGVYGDSNGAQLRYLGITATQGGIQPLTVVPIQNNIKVRIGRSGSVGYAEVTPAGATAPIRVHQVQVNPGIDLFLALNMGSGTADKIQGVGIL